MRGIKSDGGVLRRASSGAYVGPGDIVAFTRWGGLRAYKNSAIGQNILQIKRASDNATQTFVSLADGSLDIASITTFLAATTGTVTQLYDQVGNTAFWTPAVGAPAFTISGFNSKPEITFSGQALTQAGSFSQAQPFTVYGAGRRVTGTTGAATLISSFSAANLGFGWNNAVNTVRLRASTTIIAPTAADASPHVIAGLLNGASSSAWVDGAQTTGTTETTGLTSEALCIGGDGAGRNLNGYVKEVGYVNSDISANIAALTTNVRNYWGI